MRFSTAEQLKNRTESPALMCLFRFTAQYTHTGTHHCNLLHCAPLLSTSKIYLLELQFKVISIGDSLEDTSKWKLLAASATQALNQNYSNDSDQRKKAPDRNQGWCDDQGFCSHKALEDFNYSSTSLQQSKTRKIFKYCHMKTQCAPIITDW